MVEVRVSRDTAQILEAVEAPVRVTRAQGQTVFSDATQPLRVTRVQSQTIYNDRTNPIRTTFFSAQLLRSVENFDRDVPDIPDRESNPYRPTMPNEIEQVSPVLADFVQLQTETLRDQHNKTQAGDTTVPWEFLTKLGPESQFTPGSLGRFYHDDFGLIIARYVQFTGCIEGKWINGPVGRLRTAQVVDWRVTNDVSNRSSVVEPVGIIAAAAMPKEGDYGWVIVQGANIIRLGLHLESDDERGAPLVWNGFETVATFGEGRVIGRVIGKSVNKITHAYFEPGGVFIDIEGYSVESIYKALAQVFDEIETRLKDIEGIVSGVDAATVSDLQRQVTELRGGLFNEGQARGVADAGLSSRIAALEGDNVYERVLAQVNSLLDTIRARLTIVEDNANQALQLVLDADLPSMLLRLETIEAFIASIPPPRDRSLIPMVDGAIPPNLVYLPSGELVFVEVELS